MKKYEDMPDFEKLALMSFFSEDYKQKALNDEDCEVRLAAYIMFGFTEDSLKDTVEYIREAAYRKLGYTEEALEDCHVKIRLEAETYFNFMKNNKQ